MREPAAMRRRAMVRADRRAFARLFSPNAMASSRELLLVMAAGLRALRPVIWWAVLLQGARERACAVAPGHRAG